MRCWIRWALVGWCVSAGVFPTWRAARAAEPPAPSPSGAFAIRAWETDDGLPRNSVLALTQSRDGYLWLGTLNGLVRFDGLRFTLYDTGNTPGMEGNRIVSLFEDREGNLWVGIENGRPLLVRPDGIKPLDLGGGGREQRLVAACQDEQGAVWLCAADGEVGRYFAGTVNVWQVGAGRFSRYRSVVAEPGGPVWLALDGGLYEIDPRAVRPRRKLPVRRVVSFNRLDYVLASRRGGCWRLADGRITRAEKGQTVEDLGAYPWSGPARVTAACEDAEGRLIVGTLGAGVFWFAGDGPPRRFSTANGLSNDYILALTVDREGSLWVGTDGGGLNRVRRQLFHVVEATRGQVVQALAADAKGGLWVGYNGGGVDYLKDGTTRHYGAPEGLLGLPVRALLVDRRGDCWAGLWAGGLLRWRDGHFARAPTGGRVAPVVLALHEDRRGRLWVGSEGGLARWDGASWRDFTMRDGLSTNRVRVITDDAAGNLWIGTEGGGLNRWRDGTFTVFRKSPDGLPGDTVAALHADAAGALWVGLDGHGLARWRDGRWDRFSTREGLPSNSVGSIQEDDAGRLWIGTTAGLMRVARAAFDAVAAGRAERLVGRVYERADGLPTRECTMGPALDLPRPAGAQVRLWAPTIKGLAWVYPADVHPNPHAPPVVIESVWVEGRPQGPQTLRATPPPRVVVPPGRRRLEIHYTSLNLAAPERARFRYRLVGHDNEWVDAGAIRVARYSKLPPGNYRFEVIAGNEDGVWSETAAALAVIVPPPFWRTWWFLTLAVTGLLGTVVAAVHYTSTQRLRRQVARLREREALEKERARIARDLHDQLGASLTQVALLGELAESDKDFPEEVEAHARQISQTARDTTRVLDEIVWAVNPSNDTVDSLITYCCKNAQEYLTVAGLRYRQEVPEEAPGIPVPPEVRHNVFLAFKEAVTNVVRHARATEARVRVRLEPDAFILEVEDNGRGPGDVDSEAARARNGLRNMRRRMEEVGGRFDIAPAPGGGTRVTLRVPLPGAPPCPAAR